MGCTSSTCPCFNKDSKKEKPKGARKGKDKEKEGSLKERRPLENKRFHAIILIQRWFRRYMAQQETRKLVSWKVFQSLEYAEEEDHIKMNQFFTEMLASLHEKRKERSQPKLYGEDKDANQEVNLDFEEEQIMAEVEADEDDEEERLEQLLLLATDPDDISLSDDYTGPHFSLPMTTTQVNELITTYMDKEQIHPKYMLILLHEARKMLKKMPNVRRASTQNPGKKLTIVGDLHGKLEDLLIIFHKNGPPSPTNPYVINGDWTDRGTQAVEIGLVLFSYMLMYPNYVFINRGNHEDYRINRRYGFIKEVTEKFREHSKRIKHLFLDVFSWLPVSTIIDEKIITMHGGISDKLDLEFFNEIDRHKFKTLMKRPENQDEDLQRGFQMMMDMLWSDPRGKKGCNFNADRSAGTRWGPDVTTKFLKENKLTMIIRSHECKQQGFEYKHKNRVLTIFSASNYYSVGSNKGAYLTMDNNHKIQIHQFIHTEKFINQLTKTQRNDMVEDSAIKFLKSKIFANESLLMREFKRYDKGRTGVISLGNWNKVMNTCLQFQNIPWLMLRKRLVNSTDDGNIEYESLFSEYKVVVKRNSLDSKTMVVDTKRRRSEDATKEILYRNRENLETIFRALDKDHSGYISRLEFEEACMALAAHHSFTMGPEDLDNMIRAMDMNKVGPKGEIDFNEFLEAFRLVDGYGADLHTKPLVVTSMKGHVKAPDSFDDVYPQTGRELYSKYGSNKSLRKKSANSLKRRSSNSIKQVKSTSKESKRDRKFEFETKL